MKKFEFIDKKGEVVLIAYDKSDGSAQYQVWTEDGDFFGTADNLGTTSHYLRKEKGGKDIRPTDPKQGNTFYVDGTAVYSMYSERSCNFESDAELTSVYGTSRINYGGDIIYNG